MNSPNISGRAFLTTATLDNEVGSVFDFQGDGSIGGGQSTVIVDGTLRKSGGTGTSTIAVGTFNVGGSIEVAW